MEPKVSIVVPVYNGETYISSFIKCINDQKYHNLEVIFVDDGSSDKTPEILDEYAKKDGRFTVIHKANGGPSSARNCGIDRSTGEYIAFFDIDDEFSEYAISDNVQMAIQNDSELVMWNFKMVCLDIQKEYIRKVGNSFSGDAESFFTKYLISVLDNEMFNPPWNKLIKRCVLKDNNIRFNEDYSIYEDILFSYQLMQRVNKISVNDNVYYDYIIKESGSLLRKFHGECFKVILDIYKESLNYAEGFDNNSVQKERFKKQMIYLTKGYIKQVCTNSELSYKEKKKYLSEIANNHIFGELSAEFDSGKKALPAKWMMRKKWFLMLIVFYKVLQYVR